MRRNRLIILALLVPCLLFTIAAAYKSLRRPRIIVTTAVNLPPNYFEGRGYGIETFAYNTLLPRIPMRNIVLGNKSAGLAMLVLKTGLMDPGAMGYWVTFSANDGVRWTPPLYTGLAEAEPYILYPYTHFDVILHGNIRLEAHRKGRMKDKLGRNLITLLSIPLQDIRTDSDGDGLTDLVEERLLTDPLNPDTDGDMVSDIIDPAPLTARLPVSDFDRIRVATLKYIIYHLPSEWTADARRGGLILIRVETRSEIHEFPGFPSKTVHLGQLESAIYNRKFGPRAYFKYEYIQRRGDTARVHWSRGDEKGVVELYKKGTAWHPVKR